MGFREFYCEGIGILSLRQDRLQSSGNPRVGMTGYSVSFGSDNTWSGYDDHTHGYNLDDLGNGVTEAHTDVNGQRTHTHIIQNWVVLPERDHTHELNEKSTSDKNFKNS